MLRYKSDCRSLAFVVINLALLGYGLITPPSFAISGALVLQTSFAVFVSAHVNHNQMHLGIFRIPSLNVALNAVLTLCIGLPVSLIYVPHLVNHHPNACNRDDWAGLHLVEGRRGLARALIYVLRANFETARHRPRSPFWGLSLERRISLVIEALTLLAFVGFVAFAAFLFKLSFASFLLHVFLPWQIGMGGLVLMNLVVHDGCEVDSELEHSRTFTSRLGNYILLNNGYHLAHHVRPKLHWSKLASYHETELRVRAGTRFEEESLVRHLVRTYL